MWVGESCKGSRRVGFILRQAVGFILTANDWVGEQERDGVAIIWEIVLLLIVY